MGPGARLPRLLSPAEDWLLWRQCTAEATRDLDLLNRGALAEAVRRAYALAVEFGIDPSKLSLFGAEAELFGTIQHAVSERCRALRAASVQMLMLELYGAGRAEAAGSRGLPAPAAGAEDVTCAGFLQLPPRLQGRRPWVGRGGWWRPLRCWPRSGCGVSM